MNKYTLVSFAILIAGLFAGASYAQVLPTTGQTAMELVTKLVGEGVTFSSPSLTCPAGASGEFTTVTSNLGIDCGVVLTNGQVITSGNQVGVNIINGMPANATPSNFANNPNSAPGDALLTALAAHPTFDACILEFDFIPESSTIGFDYVFGSEEYAQWTCTMFNDVFGFFISGGSYGGPTNIAQVPGTAIPVCINSVNCGATGSGSLPICMAMGPGSPFCTYYVVNTLGTTITYNGITTVLAATANVTPCVTHHLKLGVADASDETLDSGVFLKAGSLTSVIPQGVASIGFAGTDKLIRTCAPGKFRFSTTPHCAETVIRYSISGTGVNGTDYAAIPSPGTITIPALASFADINVTPLALPPSTPKTVIVTLLHPDHCDPTILLPATPPETAMLTIYDTFQLAIVTPDDSICKGESVPIHITPDPIFGPFMSYNWTPTAGLSSSTVPEPTASPVVTTKYTLTENVMLVSGCRETKKDITIWVFNKPVLTTDSALVKTCVGTPVPLRVHADPDTLNYTYAWTPPTALSNNTIQNPIVSPTVPGDVTYTVSVAIDFLPACKSEDTIKVHTLPDDFTLNADTAICLGQWVQGAAEGDDEFTWRWRPHEFVADTTIRHPAITPTVTTTYTVTASYAHCPDQVHHFTIQVNYPPPTTTSTDTICLGMSKNYDVTMSTGFYNHYQWTPGTYLDNDTIATPVITPTAAGPLHYVVGIKPNSPDCLITKVVDLLVLPNTIDIHTPDTAICKGKSVQILATGHPLFTYQWYPTTGMPVSDILSPLVTPDTSTMYRIGFSFHTCPTIFDSLFIDVQPTPTVYAGGNRFVCQYETLHMIAGVHPMWYTHYNYSWTPASVMDHPNTAAPMFFSDDTTRVILTVTTPAGCKGVDSAIVNLLPGDFASMEPQKDFCPHESAILAPEGGVSYHWTPDLYISDSRAARPVIQPVTSQAYSVIATSAYGCTDTLTFTAIVHPSAVIWLEDSVRLHPGETYQINPQSNCTRFLWTPSVGLSNKYISDPVASPEVSTKYIVRASTEYNCVAIDSIDVIIDPNTLLDLPNAFAPGGPNREFKILKKGIATLNYFRIYNRWGNMVFETTDINKGWNGEYNGIPQPVGVFVYEVQAVTSTGNVFQKSGNVTLLR